MKGCCMIFYKIYILRCLIPQSARKLFVKYFFSRCNSSPNKWNPLNDSTGSLPRVIQYKTTKFPRTPREKLFATCLKLPLTIKIQSTPKSKDFIGENIKNSIAKGVVKLNSFVWTPTISKRRIMLSSRNSFNLFIAIHIMIKQYRKKQSILCEMRFF